MDSLRTSRHGARNDAGATRRYGLVPPGALAIVTCCWALFLSVVHAQAQDADAETRARRLYEVGESAFAEGEYEVALDLLRSAYELSPRPALLYNMAICADRLRRDSEAFTYYSQYLERFPSAPNRADVEARIRALRDATAGAEPTDAPAMPPAPDEPLVPPSTVVANDVTAEGWFWPVIGSGIALVLGGVVVAVVLGTTPSYEPYGTGDIGGVVFALEGRP
jgi:tetratricopeptide (TPR) repeat protein